MVFDVGGVLIEWDPRHLYRKMFDGDADAMETFLAGVCTPAWNLSLDAGRPFAEAVAELSRRHPAHAERIDAYDRRWEEMVPHALDDTVTIVGELRSRGMRLFALSNFSTEKFPLVVRRFDVFSAFEGVVLSGEVGVVKPDPAIYRHLLDRFRLSAGACLFIDDVARNVEAARALGMAAVQFTSADRLRRDLAAYGLVPDDR